MGLISRGALTISIGKGCSKGSIDSTPRRWYLHPKSYNSRFKGCMESDNCASSPGGGSTVCIFMDYRIWTSVSPSRSIRITTNHVANWSGPEILTAHKSYTCGPEFQWPRKSDGYTWVPLLLASSINTEPLNTRRNNGTVHFSLMPSFSLDWTPRKYSAERDGKWLPPHRPTWCLLYRSFKGRPRPGLERLVK